MESPGERFDPVGCNDAEKVYRHYQRYRTCALEYKGVVLDLGAGSGYGATLIQESPLVTKVQMVDKDGVGVVERGVLPGCLREVADEVYDTVTAIEFLEHLSEPKQFELVSEVYRILRPGGTFVVSTPMANRTGPNPRNPYHLWELTMADLYAVLGNQWSSKEVFTLGNPKLSTGENQPVMFGIGRKSDRVYVPQLKSNLHYG